MNINFEYNEIKMSFRFHGKITLQLLEQKARDKFRFGNEIFILFFKDEKEENVVLMHEENVELFVESMHLCQNSLSIKSETNGLFDEENVGILKQLFLKIIIEKFDKEFENFNLAVEVSLMKQKLKEHISNDRIVDEIGVFVENHLEKNDTTSISFESYSGKSLSVISKRDYKTKVSEKIESDLSINSNFKDVLENLKALNIKAPKANYLDNISEVNEDELIFVEDNSNIIKETYPGSVGIINKVSPEDNVMRSSDFTGEIGSNKIGPNHYGSEINTSKTNIKKPENKRSKNRGIRRFFKGIKNFFFK